MLKPSDLSERGGYQLEGERNDVEKLLKELREHAQNPHNYSCTLEILNPKVVTDNFLNSVRVIMSQKFEGAGDVFDIRKPKNDEIKITGFKCKDVRQALKSILDKANHFPEEWEDVEKLLIGDAHILIKNLTKGTPEWIRIEMKFKLTQSSAEITQIERI